MLVKILTFKMMPTRETRDSKCPNVTEDVITYQLRMTNGELVHLRQVVWNVISYQTRVTYMMNDPPIGGNVTIRPHLNCLPWDSPQMLEAVRQQLKPPSKLAYNFSVPVSQLPLTSLEGEVGQPRTVDELLYGGQLKSGFFLEAGSHESEAFSDSLYWELNHNWTGLLVEPNPLAHAVGLTK